MSLRHLDQLLEPSSVAVVGASDRPGAVGTTVWHNLRQGGFAGPVWPVNLKRQALDGEPVFRRVAQLPSAPDLALVCTPADTVAGLVGELAAAGCKAVVVMTAGLDAAQRQSLLHAARPTRLRVLGPDCVGLMSPHLKLNASFAHTQALAGELAFVSQSGALVTAVLDWATSRGIGFSHLLSLGEHADVDFGDLLDHLANDGRTRGILLYIESIESPRKFMSAARAAARNKPVIVVKAGRAGQGVPAAASHTGALTGADIVFDAAIRRAGMLRVDTLQQLFLAAETLARFKGQAGGALTVLTNGGGAGVMAADAAAGLGVPLAPLSPSLRARLDDLLPPHWSRDNPIDIVGDAPADRYVAALQAVLATPLEGTLLFVQAPTAIVPSAEVARSVLPVLRPHRQRVMGCFMGEASVAEARRIFEQAGIAGYATPEEAVQAVALLATHARNQEALREAPSPSALPAADARAARGLIDTVLSAGRAWLSEAESKQLLAAYGIPVVATTACAVDAEAAVQAADVLGYPVAVKIISQDIVHKSEAGGVLLNLSDAAAVRSGVAAMLARLRQERPAARLEGLSVQRMARRPLAQELIVGASVDPVFGPVLLFGAGGTAVEVLADRAVALPPLNRALAAELVSRTRVSRLLAGWGDRPPAAADALHDVLIAVARMLADLPELAELDINPLWADDQGVLALDARARLSPERPAGEAAFAIRPYPKSLVEAWDWHGRPVTLRPIRPEDEAQHLRFLEAVDPEDMRLRIFSSRRHLPRSELARLTQIDYEREMALIAEADAPGGGRETLAVVRALSDADGQEAEFALLVRSDCKGRGLGGRLLDKMIDHLRQRGVRRLVAWVLRENRGMIGLGRSRGMAVEVSPDDHEVLRLVREL
ncbi:bifunctional acetate--CoA ligase family protein/GNAT family N-acetyltransferase [Aquabacterium sp. J223]|uniref:bifunctional acetate--CoA ligase family protein/GNAT family N-acetyltransferase n=1 Tax=Aquabacterium sp. J223 TaxID=2898431 RepID=UPI0021AD5601|nr:bifunctional acetate--CoA ligase family protein/GNAT family N-acetyltransferase [Aquabacterium sp. J223]UUX94097.1 bifunctional acetate--CoA ligase family protein/GNAT family N-acetyltransferase [Aquabacterium sp. J223]